MKIPEAYIIEKTKNKKEKELFDRIGIPLYDNNNEEQIKEEKKEKNKTIIIEL